MFDERKNQKDLQVDIVASPLNLTLSDLHFVVVQLHIKVYNVHA